MQQNDVGVHCNQHPDVSSGVENVARFLHPTKQHRIIKQMKELPLAKQHITIKLKSFMLISGAT